MKTILIGAMCVLSIGCKQPEKDPVSNTAAERTLQSMAADRDQALRENARLYAENRRLELQVADLKGDIFVMQAEVKAAQSQVDNAYKQGEAEANIKTILGE